MSNRPMNVYLPVAYKRNDGSEGSEFHKVGVAWRLKEKRGFQLDIRIPLVLGGRAQRLVVMPPKEVDEPEQEEPPLDDWA